MMHGKAKPGWKLKNSWKRVWERVQGQVKEIELPGKETTAI